MGAGLKGQARHTFLWWVSSHSTHPQDTEVEIQYTWFLEFLSPFLCGLAMLVF